MKRLAGSVLRPEIEVYFEIVMDNSPRHCWINVLNGKRLLAAATLHDVPCTKDHSDNPKVVDQVEWMRFIRAAIKVFGEANPFVPKIDNGIVLNTESNEVIEGHPFHFAEEYYDERGIVFKVHLNPEIKLAAIQCFRKDMVDNCLKVLDIVETSYA